VSARRKAWATAWRIAICAILLAWICHSIFVNETRAEVQQQGRTWNSLPRAEQWRLAWSSGPSNLWRTLTLVNPLSLIASFSLVGATLLIGVWRWNLVLKSQGLALSFARTIEISLVAHFFNSFLLGSTGGDLLKAYYAARETHHLKTEAVSTVLVDRLIGLLSMLMFAALLLLPSATLIFSQHQLAAPALLMLAMLAGFALLATLSFWGGLSKRYPNARRRLRQLPKGPELERVLEACRGFGRNKALLGTTIALSMLLNTACVLQFFVLSKALGMTVPPVILCFVVPTIVCIAALPITPSGLGVRENLFVVMLAAPGINAPANLSLSLSLLAYAGSLAWSLLGGIVYACFKHRHHLDTVASDS